MSIEQETGATIEAIGRLLAANDVVRVTTCLRDTRGLGRYNKVFAYKPK